MGALDGLTGTSSFGATHFWLLQTGGRSLPQVGRVSSYSRKKIPYGDAAVVELGGRDYPPIERQLLIKTSDVAALLALVNTTATLTIVGTSFGTAALVEVSGIEAYDLAYSTLHVRWEF